MKKSIFPLLLAVAALSFTIPVKKVIETSFWVNHDCDMCKERILHAVDMNGVKNAEYNMDTYMLTVVYNPDKITLEEIHQAIADAGYDTSLMKASDQAYHALPECCQYDRSRRSVE